MSVLECSGIWDFILSRNGMNVIKHAMAFEREFITLKYIEGNDDSSYFNLKIL